MKAGNWNPLSCFKILDKKTSGALTGELQAQMTEGTGSQLVGLWNMSAMDTRAIKDHLKNNPYSQTFAKEFSLLAE